MQVFINKARLSFPDLFQATAINNGTPKFGCDLIIEDGTEVIAVKADGTKAKTTMGAVIKAVGKEAWADKAERIMAAFDSDQSCHRDGNKRMHATSGEVYEGYEGHSYVTAKNKRKPTVVDRDRSPLTEESGKPYSGCYVNAKIDVYANKKAGQMGVFAALMGVQFAADGDAFAGGGVASADDFDDLGGDDDLLGDDFGATGTDDLV